MLDRIASHAYAYSIHNTQQSHSNVWVPWWMLNNPNQEDQWTCPKLTEEKEKKINGMCLANECNVK